MKKLYLVIHQLAKDRYHYALSDEVGEPLAETRDFPSEAECRAIKNELVGILKDCANGRRKASAYQCGQYVYHAIKQDDVFLLRTKTSDTLDESKVVWDQLMQCVRIQNASKNTGNGGTEHGCDNEDH